MVDAISYRGFKINMKKIARPTFFAEPPSLKGTRYEVFRYWLILFPVVIYDCDFC